MNGFEKHGITHLSPSSLNLWINAPDRWIAEKLFGHRSPLRPSAARGIVVEDAVSAVLRGEMMEDAAERALEAFDEKLGLQAGSPRAQKERGYIGLMIGEAVDALQDFGAPEFDADDGQFKVKRTADLGDGISIEWIGYLDFMWPDHRLVIDLKTTAAMPSIMPVEHQRQRAFYSIGVQPDHAVKFLYVTPRKWAFHEHGDIAALIAEMKWHARRLERWLRLDLDAITALAPVNTSTFYWADCASQAREIYGVPAVA